MIFNLRQFLFFAVCLLLCSILSAADESQEDEGPYAKDETQVLEDYSHRHNLLVPNNRESGFNISHIPHETLRIGGYVQIDGRFFCGEDQPKSTFLVRRARLIFTGELYKMFRYRIEPRWDNQRNIDLEFAWLETLHPQWARIRMGLFKEPFSLEALKRNRFRTFNELSLPVRNYCRIRDVGIAAFGDFDSETISYGFGFFNGTGTIDLDNNNNKMMVGRLIYRILDSKRFGRIYLGFSGASGKIDEDLSGEEFSTETFNPFWMWTDNSNHPVENHATRKRWGADIEWLAGPFYFAAEYLYTNWGKIRMGHHSATFDGYGGYAECSYLLTGEDKPRDEPLFPRHNFEPCKNHWGAFEIAARYEIFYASKKMIDLGFAQGANYLHGPIVGLNWYLNPLVAVKIDAQYIWFNRPFTNNGRKFRYEIDLISRIQATF